MKIPKGGIGFFDSGMGGLTVMADCRKAFPNEIFYYYGDHHNAPYGNRSEGEIFSFVLNAMESFKRLEVKAVVLACNTVTAVCIDVLRRLYDFPIIGTEPAVKVAAERGGNIFVLTTMATANSSRFQNLLRGVSIKYPDANIMVKPCRLLAGAIEKNYNNSRFDYTRYLPKGGPDGVVLGCTHYLYIREKIADYYQCLVYDGNQGICKRLQEVLKKLIPKNLENEKKCFSRPFLTTNGEKCGSANKSSCFLVEKARKISQDEMLFFIGKSKGKGHKTYKQMFVFSRRGRKWWFCGQKNEKK